MLVGTEVMNRIDDLVERSYLDFTFKIIGEDFFTDEQKAQIAGLGLIIGRRPLIELLYILVRQRSTPGYRRDINLQQLLDQIAETGVLPTINDSHRYTIEHGKAKINEAIENTKNEVKKKVTQQILEANNEYKNEVAVAGITSLPQTQEKAGSIFNKLILGVGAAVLAVQSGFLRDFTTAFTEFTNNTAVDSATTDLEIPVPSTEVKVYKRVVNDASLCQWCDAFYTHADGSPKVYTLKELQANGSNEGKPKSAWRPTIGPTHPRCRCQLHYLRGETDTSH